MKHLIFYLFISLSAGAFSNEQTISGKVTLPEGCSKKAMVWLSLDKENYKERLLLMHTEVPSGGSFRFYVKPGDYQVRASDKEGCEFLKKVSIRGEDLEIKIILEKK